MSYRHRIGIGASIVLGIIFVTAGLGKLLASPTPTRGFQMIFDPFPDFLVPVTTSTFFNWLAYIETAIGLLLIIGIMPKLMAVLSAVLIAGFITNNAWLISRGLGYEPCSCFGILDNITRVRLSTIGSLYLDIVMLALVIIVLLCHKSSFFNIYPHFLRRGNND